MLITSYKLIIFIFCIILLIIFMTLFNKVENKTSSISCRIPTMNNPYANHLITDLTNLSACNNKYYDMIKDKYNNFNVYYNAKNININSMSKNIRTFYTTTITNNPNNLNEFINFVYT